MISFGMLTSALQREAIGRARPPSPLAPGAARLLRDPSFTCHFQDALHRSWRPTVAGIHDSLRTLNPLPT